MLVGVLVQQMHKSDCISKYPEVMQNLGAKIRVREDIESQSKLTHNYYCCYDAFQFELEVPIASFSSIVMNRQFR